MKLVEPGRSLEFDLLEYRHDRPHRREEDWLSVRVTYREGTTAETYMDSCLQAWEARELLDGFAAVIAGAESSYISDFMEPMLKVAIARTGDRVTFILHFVYDTADGDWKTRRAAAEWSIGEAEEALQDLRRYKEPALTD